jgi:hypothetical protein
MLGKTIEKHQWFSLFMLAIGVALVTVRGNMNEGKMKMNFCYSGHHRKKQINVYQHKVKQLGCNNLSGLVR